MYEVEIFRGSKDSDGIELFSHWCKHGFDGGFWNVSREAGGGGFEYD